MKVWLAKRLPLLGGFCWWFALWWFPKASWKVFPYSTCFWTFGKFAYEWWDKQKNITRGRCVLSSDSAPIHTKLHIMSYASWSHDDRQMTFDKLRLWPSKASASAQEGSPTVRAHVVHLRLWCQKVSSSPAHTSLGQETPPTLNLQPPSKFSCEAE